MAKGKYAEWLQEDKLVLLQGWARSGLTDEQIAHNIGISRNTLNEWKKKFPPINDTIKKGKEVIDYEVENALLKKALGYDYEEVTKERLSNGELAVTKVVKKHVQGDTTAQIFWLKNRKSKDWRDKPTQDNDTTTLIESINSLNKAMIENVAPNRKLEDFEE